MDDLEFSRELTATIRRSPGITDVFPAQPILEAAAAAIAVRLALHQPDILVDIDRVEGFVTVGAHIATSAAIPAGDTARIVGELVRDLVQPTLPSGTGLAVNVKVRLIDDSPVPGETPPKE